MQAIQRIGAIGSHVDLDPSEVSDLPDLKWSR